MSLSKLPFVHWDRTFRKGLTSRTEIKCHKSVKPSASKEDLETPERGNSYGSGKPIHLFSAITYPFLKQRSWGYACRAACKEEDAGVRQVRILLCRYLQVWSWESLGGIVCFWKKKNSRNSYKYWVGFHRCGSFMCCRVVPWQCRWLRCQRLTVCSLSQSLCQRITRRKWQDAYK